MNNDIPDGCLPFDLKKALAGHPVVNRDWTPCTVKRMPHSLLLRIFGLPWLTSECRFGQCTHFKDGSAYVFRCNDLFLLK